MKKTVMIGLLAALLLCLALMLLLRHTAATAPGPESPSPVPTSLPAVEGETEEDVIADAEAWTVEDFVVEIGEEQAVEIH